jgi:hypothetical protein
LWDTVGTPKLPLWVEKRAADAAGEKNDPIAWLPELSALAAQIKQRSQLGTLAKINAYLIENRGKLIPVPYRERSLKIFGDEHAMDSMIDKGQLFQGRLSLDAVYAFEVGEPMPYERPPSLLTGKALLIVENHHSFASFTQVNAAKDIFSAVCFASGQTLTTREYSLDGIGARLKTREYLYLGDIDPRGFSIPIEVNAKRRQRGVPLLKPATDLYAWLLRHGRGMPVRKRQSPVDREKVAAWFSGDREILGGISKLFEQKLRIPQEFLGTEELLRLEILGGITQ